MNTLNSTKNVVSDNASLQQNSNTLLQSQHLASHPQTSLIHGQHIQQNGQQISQNDSYQSMMRQGGQVQMGQMPMSFQNQPAQNQQTSQIPNDQLYLQNLKNYAIQQQMQLVNQLQGRISHSNGVNGIHKHEQATYSHQTQQTSQMQSNQSVQPSMGQGQNGSIHQPVEQRATQQVVSNSEPTTLPPASTLTQQAKARQESERNCIVIGGFRIKEDIFESLPKPTPNADPDNCFVCKRQGEFITCAGCEKPFHLFCAELDKMPETQWECKECQNISRQRLILMLKEKARLKAIEREQRKIQEKENKEMKRIERENELKQKREAKEFAKKLMKEQKINAQIERQRIVVEQMAAQAEKNSTEQTQQQEAPNKFLTQFQQSLAGLSGQLPHIFGSKQTTLNINNSFQPKKKKETILTQAEIQRIERNRRYKSQLAQFSSFYPEFVERNSIRYPIPDHLLAKYPDLHNYQDIKKPDLMKISIPCEEFERVLYIWEFCNNFSEYLETPFFSISELRAALAYTFEDDPRMSFNDEQLDELDWNETMELRHLKEKGFHFFNVIHTALATCFLKDMFPEEQKANTSNLNGQQSGYQFSILQAINKIIAQKEQFWPEIIRLILINLKGQDELVFGEQDEKIEEILKILPTLRPQSYISDLSYDQKILLMTVLIDNIHDTNEFRTFLSKRIEVKAIFNKEKMDVYAQIKQYEVQLEEMRKKSQDEETKKLQSELTEEYESLRTALMSASRTESKEIRDKINSVKSQRIDFEAELNQISEQIKRKQAVISRLNEKAGKTAIKQTVVGRDAQMNEYWFFKDDPSKLYVKVETKVPKITDSNQTNKDLDNGNGLEGGDLVMINEEEISLNVIGEHKSAQGQTKPEAIEADAEMEIYHYWAYYEREDQFDQLIESLNIKGQREKKLQEGLRKVRERLKLKKAKKVLTTNNNDQTKDIVETGQTVTIQPSEVDKDETKTIEPTCEDGKQTPQVEKEEAEKLNGEITDGQRAGEQLTTEAKTKHEAARLTSPSQEQKSQDQQQHGQEEQKQKCEENDGQMTKAEGENVEMKNEVTEKENTNNSKDDTVSIKEEEDDQEKDDDGDDEGKHEDIRHVIFENDNWEDCIRDQVWFGQKIPQRRRFFGRGASNVSKDPVLSFFEEDVNLNICIKLLLQISEDYTDASKNHEREWEEADSRKRWETQVNEIESVRDAFELIKKLDDGMSLPFSKLVRKGQNGEPDKVQRMKLQLFKFWPSSEMKDTWRSYLEAEGSVGNGNIFSFYILLKILATVNEQFVIRQAEKMEKKNKMAIQAAQTNEMSVSVSGKRGAKSQNRDDGNQNSRYQRAAVRQANFVKYFESSSEEEEEGEEEQQEEKVGSENQSEEEDAEEEQEESGESEESEVNYKKTTGRKAAKTTKSQAQTKSRGRPQKQVVDEELPAKKGRKGRGGRRTVPDEEMQSEQSEEKNDETESEDDGSEEDESKEWEEYCFVCNDGGNVLCCETCTQVAHRVCVGLKQDPKGDWYCKDCVEKKQTQKKVQQIKQAPKASSKQKLVQSNLPFVKKTKRGGRV